MTYPEEFPTEEDPFDALRSTGEVCAFTGESPARTGCGSY